MRRLRTASSRSYSGRSAPRAAWCRWQSGLGGAGPETTWREIVLPDLKASEAAATHQAT